MGTYNAVVRERANDATASFADSIGLAANLLLERYAAIAAIAAASS